MKRKYLSNGVCIAAISVFLLSACQTTQDRVKQDAEIRKLARASQAKRDAQAKQDAEIRELARASQAKRDEQAKQEAKWAAQRNAEADKELETFTKELKADGMAYADHTVDAKLAVIALAPKSVTCKASAWMTSMKLIEAMEQNADKRWKLYNRDDGLYRLAATRDTNLTFFNLFTGDAIKVRLGIADLATKKGCLDIADKHYRHVIRRYTGISYAAHRERAKIGIDDVRQKRKP